MTQLPLKQGGRPGRVRGWGDHEGEEELAGVEAEAEMQGSGWAQGFKVTSCTGVSTWLQGPRSAFESGFLPASFLGGSSWGRQNWGPQVEFPALTAVGTGGVNQWVNKLCLCLAGRGRGRGRGLRKKEGVGKPLVP